MTYDELLIQSDSKDIRVKELPLAEDDGRIRGNRIAIRNDIPTLTEKSCVLAEELGHYHTTYGNIIDQSDVMNRKQELRARMWGYNRLIGLTGIINAYKKGCRNLAEMADELDVTEKYLKEALKAYHNKYGTCATIDKYIIYFEPSLSVMKLY